MLNRWLLPCHHRKNPDYCQFTAYIHAITEKVAAASIAGRSLFSFPHKTVVAHRGTCCIAGQVRKSDSIVKLPTESVYASSLIIYLQLLMPLRPCAVSGVILSQPCDLRACHSSEFGPVLVSI